ncbi:MAG: response regulator [Chloroflexi bacterium]|nr:response regulator [Chloroflexota bacterium]
MPSSKHTLLIVEDDQALADMLKAYFTMQGFDVLTSAWGEKGVRLAQENQPALVLLDVRLPDIDGFEVCERLQASHVTRRIPVIFLTERSERVDKLRGLGLGVIDYITKPFDIQEVRLRVRNVIRRSEEASSEHPVTGLPEGKSVEAALGDLLESSAPWTLLVARLGGLKTFRELYGFVASDDVLRVTAVALHKAATEVAAEEGFCGHLHDDVFAIVLPPSKVNPVFDLIDRRLVSVLSYFYPSSNRGDKAAGTDRLRLYFTTLTADDGPFPDGYALKIAALENKAPSTAP